MKKDLDRPDLVWSNHGMILRNISQAKAELSSLLARVQEGEEVLIGKAGKPIARLTAYTGSGKPRHPGSLKGKIRIREDFDSLPAEIAKAFGILSQK